MYKIQRSLYSKILAKSERRVVKVNLTQIFNTLTRSQYTYNEILSTIANFHFLSKSDILRNKFEYYRVYIKFLLKRDRRIDIRIVSNLINKNSSNYMRSTIRSVRVRQRVLLDDSDYKDNDNKDRLETSIRVNTIIYKQFLKE